MFREDVANHYRDKGYKLHEHVKIRGQSGTVHAIDMVAQSPLGNLVISFENDGDFEGPEMGAIRRAARDIGATPVVAVEHMPDGLRQHAARAGVVLLDHESMQAPKPDFAPDFNPVPPEPEPTPWPSQDRTRRSDGDMWRYERDAPKVESRGIELEPAPESVETSLEPPKAAGFDWLPKGEAPKPVATPAPAAPRTPEAKQEVLLGLRVVLIVLLGGAAAGGAFFGLSFLF